MLESGLLQLQPASDGSAYKEYVLTDKGRSVFPIVVGLRQWGEQFLFEAGEARSELLDSASGKPIETLLVRAQDGRVVGPEDCRRRVISHG